MKTAAVGVEVAQSRTRDAGRRCRGQPLSNARLRTAINDGQGVDAELLRSLAPLAGNAAVQALVQRAPVATAAPPATVAGPNAIGTPGAELEPLLDVSKYVAKMKLPKGDANPAPGAKDAIAEADVAWIDDIKNERLKEWLAPQIDKGHSVINFEKRLRGWVAEREKPYRTQLGQLAKKKQKTPKELKAQTDLPRQFALHEAAVSKAIAGFTVSNHAGRTNLRKAFLGTMRCLVGPDPAPKEHFNSLVEVLPKFWLAKEAAASLLRVKEELPGKKLPSTDVGQGLRGRHVEVHGLGFWGHALGFSADWKAYENPHFTDARTARLVDMVTGGRGFMRFTRHDKPHRALEHHERRGIIKAMGEKTAAGVDPRADKQMAALLDQVDTQYLEMLKGSRMLQTDEGVLPAENRRQLDLLRKDYVSSHGELSKARGEVMAAGKALKAHAKALAKAAGPVKARMAKEAKAAGLDPKAAVTPEAVEKDPALAPLVAARNEAAAKHADALKAKAVVEAPLKERMRKVFEPWLERIKKEYLDLDAAAAGKGLVLAKLPDLSKWKYNALEDTLQLMAQREKSIPRAQWATDKTLAKMRKSIAPSLAKVTAAFADPDVVATKSAAELFEAVRLVRGFVWKRMDRKTMQRLYDGLSGDLTYTLGVIEAVPERYRVKGGDQYWLRPGYGIGKEIPVAQLLETPGDRAGIKVGGYIQSSEHGINQIFMKTMVRHGWDPGAAWAGGADTMHFDYVKGFERAMAAGVKKCGPHGRA